MNKEKVYLEGYVVGHAADTLGYKGLQIQLENMDIVEVDKNLVYKNVGEPQKLKVPQGVANYIEYTKVNEWDLLEAMNNVSYEDDKELRKWFNNNAENFALAWIFGCETEEEKRYRVCLKNGQPLLKAVLGKALYFSQDIAIERYEVTRKQLEKDGFGWVFDCPGVEIEEVEE